MQPDSAAFVVPAAWASLCRRACTVLATAWLAACGGGGGDVGIGDNLPATVTAAAARAGVSVMTFRDLTFRDLSQAPIFWVQMAFLDTLDSETGYRVEKQVGTDWQTVAELSAQAGTGATLYALERGVTVDTVYRVLALLPDGQTVAMQTPSQQTQFTARLQLPGVSIALAGQDQPLSGDTTVSISGGAKLLSVQYQAIPVSDNVSGNGGLDGSSLLLTGPDFLQVWRGGGLGDGVYLVRAKVEVEPGSFAELYREVSLHNSGLKVSAVADVNGQDVTLRVNLESNVKNPFITVSVDGSQVKQQTLDSGWQISNWSVPLGTLDAGDRTVVVEAGDSTGARASVTIPVTPQQFRAAGLRKVKTLSRGCFSGNGLYGAYKERLVVLNSCGGGNRPTQLFSTTTAADSELTQIGGGLFGPHVKMNADWTFFGDRTTWNYGASLAGSNTYGNNRGCTAEPCFLLVILDIPMRNWALIGTFPSNQAEYMVDLNTGTKRVSPGNVIASSEPMDTPDGLQWYVEGPALYNAKTDKSTPLAVWNAATDSTLISDNKRLVWLRSTGSDKLRVMTASATAPVQAQTLAGDFQSCGTLTAAAGIAAWCELSADGVTRTLKGNDGGSTFTIASGANLGGVLAVGEDAVVWTDNTGTWLYTAGSSRRVLGPGESSPVLTQRALFVILDKYDLYRFDY